MITSDDRVAGPYNCDGSDTTFEFAFKVFTAADVLVVLTSAAGAESELVLNTDYTVALNADQDASPGGVVTTIGASSPRATGNKITITSQVAETQGTQLPSGGNWNAKVVEAALDKLTILFQQLKNLASRGIRQPISDAALMNELPSAANRASKFLSFDASGNPIADSGVASSVGSYQSPETGGISRTWTSKVSDIVSAKDFASLQEALNILTGGTSVNGPVENPAIYLGPNTYTLTTSLLPPEEASFYTIYGDSPRTSRIVWNGAAGQPVIKFRNVRRVTLRDFMVEGKTTAKPSYLVQFHRDSGWTVGTGGTLGVVLERMMLGNGDGCHKTGVAFTADGGHDANNEQAAFFEVDIAGSEEYCYHFAHSNSLLHKIVGGNLANYGIAAINNVMSGSNYHASFSAWGVTFGGNTDSAILHLGQPRFAINLYNCYHENVAADNTKVLTQPAEWTDAGMLNFWGCQFAMGDPDPGEYTIEFDAATRVSQLNFNDCSIYAPSGVTLNLLGGRVCFNGGALSSSNIRYEHAEVWLRNCKQGAGALTLTKVGGGTGFVDATDRSAGGNEVDKLPVITAGTSLSVSGRAQKLLELAHAGATNLDTLTDGYVGQIVGFFAVNGNTTIVHTAAATADKLFLRDAANWTMRLGDSIWFVRSDNVSGSNRWLEISRNEVEIKGSATYDPANLVDGAGATTTVTATGAVLGDFAEASFSLDVQGITVTAWVSAANTVSVRFQNETGGAIDLASGTLRVKVKRQ